MIERSTKVLQVQFAGQNIIVKTAYKIVGTVYVSKKPKL